jgi:hypothetical protein
MKKLIVAVLVFALALIACGVTAPTPTPIVIVVTATSRPVIASPVATNTPHPTATPKPTQIPLTINDVEMALQEHGYTRAPFNDPARPGVAGYSWTKDNVYEQVYTWNDGHFRLEVLHDKSPVTRARHMEDKFQVLDLLFSHEFMAGLRQANDDYNKSVGPSVTGDPAALYPSGNEWHEIWGQYDVSNTYVESLPVTFALWFWQMTCPAQYAYCYMVNFPGQEFVGDTSFIFYTIEISLAPSGPGGGGGNG